MPEPSLAEFERLNRRSSGPCIVGRGLHSVEEQDRTNAEAAIIATHIGDTAVAKWFKTRGVQLSAHAVRAHRTGECCCER